MPFNIGPLELIIVLVIALLILGPGKLPEVGSALGKSIREFRKAATDVQEATSVDVSQPATTTAPQAAPAPAPAQVAPVAAAPIAAAPVVAAAVAPSPAEVAPAVAEPVAPVAAPVAPPVAAEPAPVSPQPNVLTEAAVPNEIVSEPRA